jgi:DNA-directed RNA polymerase subunit RPC12/RpoP
MFDTLLHRGSNGLTGRLSLEFWAMIKFSCPRCGRAFEHASPGIKFNCNCGQRLEVPSPPPNKTVLGALLDDAAPVNANALPTAIAVPERISEPVNAIVLPDEYEPLPPRPRRRFRCPFCGSRRMPVRESKVSTGGWIMFTIGIAFVPLFFIGLILIFLGLSTKDEYTACDACGAKLHGIVGDFD